MPNQFKYFALHYLNLWLLQERECCEALSDSNSREKKLAALQRAASFFSIARSFGRRYDRKERLGPILDIIEAERRANFSGSKLVGEVELTSAKISRRYGRKGILSATTKFLWLKFQSPVLIYDRQARKALSANVGDYGDYCSKWSRAFKDHESEIANACNTLPRLYEYARPTTPPVPAGYIASIVRKQWFRERVLDVYLWEQGQRQLRETRE